MSPSKSKFSSPQIPGHKPPVNPIPKAVKPKEWDFVPKVSLKVDSLPSRSKSYPPGSSISYRGFTFGEVKRVSQEKRQTKDVFLTILEGVECSFDSLDLTVADVMFIGLLRKISTFGTETVICTYNCTSCGKSNQSQFKLSDIEFEDMTAEAIPVSADFSFGEVVFHPITIRDFFALVDRGTEQDEIAILAAQGVLKDATYEKLYEAFYNLSPDDAEILEEVDSYLYHGLKPRRFDCLHCKAVSEIELDGGEALLLPFREGNRSVRRRIRFGAGTPHKS